MRTLRSLFCFVMGHEPATGLSRVLCAGFECVRCHAVVREARR